MQSEHSTQIVARFFAAVKRLTDEHVIRGTQTFTRRYGINRWNFITCSRDHRRNIFQVAWLAYLVNDYGVNPEWLLTGNGEFYADGRKPATDLQVNN